MCSRAWIMFYGPSELNYGQIKWHLDVGDQVKFLKIAPTHGGHAADGALPALRIVADGRLRRRAAGYGRDYYCRRGYDVWDRLYRAREACG